MYTSTVMIRNWLSYNPSINSWDKTAWDQIISLQSAAIWQLRRLKETLILIASSKQKNNNIGERFFSIAQ